MNHNQNAENGVSKLAIQEAEKKINLVFPEAYRMSLLKSDGWSIEGKDARILSLRESIDYLEGMRSFGITQTWGYFPILDNEDSNPWCICCRPLLSGYIVQVNHDDAAQIKFRNIDGFVDAIRAGDSDDSLLVDHLETDFQADNRTSDDIRVAHELVANLMNYRGDDRGDACRFAMWLFGPGQVDQIASFLEDDDSFVARDARERLEAMAGSPARTAIEAADRNLKDFINWFQSLLTHGGFQASVENDSIIRVNPGNLLLDGKSLYSQRKHPNAEEYFIGRVRSMLSKRNQ